MAANDQYKTINERFIKILQELLETGDWQASLFLRTAHKKIQSLHDEAVALANELESRNALPQENFHHVKSKQGYVKIFVSIYQSDPHNMVKWENTLKTIKEHSINRPIYRAEEYIQEMIRSKHGSPNEGYVVIYVEPSDIIPPYSGKLVEDKWGHELLTLRDNSLSPDNIAEFVHQGRRYGFHEGKLVLKSDNR